MNKVAITGYVDTKYSQEEIPIDTLMLEATKLLFEQNSNSNKGQT